MLPRAMALHDVHRAWLRHMVLVVDPEYQLPPPITYPEDLHPLPDDIEAYCRYSFRSEDLVSQSPHLSSAQFRAMCDRHAAVLTERGITLANSGTHTRIRRYLQQTDRPSRARHYRRHLLARPYLEAG